jgi:hypothetical protein
MLRPRSRVTGTSTRDVETAQKGSSGEYPENSVPTRTRKGTERKKTQILTIEYTASEKEQFESLELEWYNRQIFLISIFLIIVVSRLISFGIP